MKASSVQLLLSFFLIMLCTISCKQKTMTPLEFNRFVQNESNGFLVKHSNEGISYQAQLKPSALLALQAINKNNSFDEQAFYENILKFKNHYSFTISAKSLIGRSVKDHLELIWGNKLIDEQLQEIQYRYQDKFRLVIGDDTSKAVLYHPEIVSFPEKDIVFSVLFEKEDHFLVNNMKKVQDVELLFFDPIMGSDTIVFKYPAELTEYQPQLKF